MMNQPLRSLLLALVAAVFALAAVGPAQAQTAGQIGSEKKIGIGLGHGTYTAGVTGKFYLDQASALQLFVGNFGGLSSYDYGYDCNFRRTFRCGLSVSADYVNEFQTLVNDAEAGRLFLGAGGGGYLYSPYYTTGAGFGINGVFELGWHFAQIPIEFVADIRPVLDLTRGFLVFDGGVAARFYF